MDFSITHVRYAALAVPDLQAESEFLVGPWGLKRVRGEETDAQYFSAAASAEPYVLRLRAGPQARLEVLALAAVDRQEVLKLHDRVARGGGQILRSPEPLARSEGGYGFRFYDLDGRVIEVSSDVERRSSSPVDPKAALPLDLSHVVMHTPEPAAAAAFYERMLGFQVADWLADRMCFLRSGAKHHCLAFVVGEPNLNHIAYDMGSTNEVMRGAGRMLRQNFPISWGPGRHTAGDNTFAYFKTPNGLMMEYTAELEEVGDDWRPTTYPMTPEIADQWGTGGQLKPHQSKRDPGLWSEPPW